MEGFEEAELDVSAGTLNVTVSADDGSVGGILVFRTESKDGEHTDIAVREWVVSLDGAMDDGEFVGGERTRFVRTEDGKTGQILDDSEAGDNSRVLDKLLETDGKSDNQESGEDLETFTVPDVYSCAIPAG